MGFFVPFFFAYTGIKVDLTTLRGSAFAFTVAAVVVACLGKIIGGGLGAQARRACRDGRPSPWGSA